MITVKALKRVYGGREVRSLNRRPFQVAQSGEHRSTSLDQVVNRLDEMSVVHRVVPQRITRNARPRSPWS